MFVNDKMETVSTEVTSIRRQNDIEKSTWRSHRYFESTSKFPGQIDGESTKMCPLGKDLTVIYTFSDLAGKNTKSRNDK